ncbi:Uncharacterized protein GBIM_11987 [Gryllus bimaculatus]|nr:Uncharacterized protein GBIM_11987 [Gryllus bimaculatus]
MSLTCFTRCPSKCDDCLLSTATRSAEARRIQDGRCGEIRVGRVVRMAEATPAQGRSKRVALGAMAACSGSTSDPEDRQTAAEPRTPSWNIKTLTRTFSQDTSTSTATWFSGTGTLLKSKHEEDPPAHYETRFCTLGFALKIVEWTLCILCTGLFFEGSALIYDFKKQLVPYIAYWTYMMITGVVILSYLLGQKMREMLIRIYNIIGALMFFIAAIIIFSITVENWESWNRVDPTTPPPPTTTASPKKQRNYEDVAPQLEFQMK